MTQEYTESFFLSAGEVNAEGEMSLPLLTSKIIDIATAHANSLGIGNPDMSHLGLGWVLSRLTIEMSRWPLSNENYSITTWIENWNRHFSIRCFMIADGEGKECGFARSVWMVMNTKTRENAGLTHLELPECMIGTRECPIPRQTKHTAIIPADYTDDIPHGMHATLPGQTYTFKYCDLDYYRHVNTVRYISILLNQFPLERHDTSVIRRMELNFLHEARYAETVEILTSETDENSYSMSLIPASGEMEYSHPFLFARIFFSPRP